MSGRKLAVSVAFVLCWLHAEALPVHLQFEWPSGMPSTVTHVRVQAVRSAGYTKSAAPVEVEAEQEGATLELGHGVWEVQVFAPGYWSEATEIAVERQAPDGVRLALWPAASLHGEIVAAEGEPLPPNLDLQLSGVPESADGQRAGPGRELKPALFRARLRCPIEGQSWTCIAPAGTFDVRLQTAEYTPQYLWGVSFKASRNTNLGRTVLRRTASVFGRAVRNDGSDPPNPCQAILLPDVERHGPDPGVETPPMATKTFSVALSRRGYFQIVGVPPGRHMLAIECQAASSLRELDMQANRETRIDPPVRLEELTLDIAITPKVDPAGQRWRLTVDATAPHFQRIANGEASSAEGYWVRHGLMAGKYRVVVSGSDGTAWLQRNFDLGASSGPLLLRLGSVAVAGRALLSSQPIRARLVFSNNASGESAKLSTDDNGRFRGVLPVTPGLQESTWTVEAHVLGPPVTQRLLDVKVPPPHGAADTWLDLDFPAVPVRGSVVSPDGKPQPNVQVIFEDSAGTRTTTGTDDNGRFEMSDLPAGKYTAVADSPAGSSDRTSFEIADGSGSELRLVLNPFKRVPFYVVSSQGPVEDAAVQVWIAPGVPRAFARTDADGRFEVTLPPGTAEVGLTVAATGYALKLIRLPVPSADDDSREARTITLDPSAGTLLLKFQPPKRPGDDSAAFYLVHNRAIQDARSVVGSGTDQAGVGSNAQATIDAIEPGDYALCRVDPGKMAALWSGALPSGACTKGALDQGGTLTLSVQ